ncbi:MAG: hypothetical protein EPN21_20270 [Methylococcaceae bacterium]|nr:MAG: hypothetical protein EPN21_20270 [Methylococcaceae bacterium]
MKKSYSNFAVADIKALGLNVVNGHLFEQIQPVAPGELLLQLLAAGEGVPLQSEKAKSEMLISPLINAVRLKNPKKMTYFSGYQFNVDEKRGLKGFCDFLISKKYNAIFIESPLLAVVEAKHNQDLLDATPQCIAEMYAAQIFNEREGHPSTFIYGAVTTGYEWLFLRLAGNNVIVDTARYGLKNIPELLGVWQIVIDSFAGSEVGG